MNLKDGMRFLVKYHEVIGSMIEIREVREEDVRVYVLDPYGNKQPEGLIVPKRAFGDRWGIYIPLDEDDNGRRHSTNT